MRGGTVSFAVPAEVAFDYLTDPRNRPGWQVSLRRVEDVTGEPGVGQSWTDVTVPGMRPRMRTTELERPLRWSEAGEWLFVEAELTLVFTATDTGCDVDYRFRVEALGPIGLVATALSLPAVGADLRRAARILEERVTNG
jgi:hypothetical protein